MTPTSGSSGRPRRRPSAQRDAAQARVEAYWEGIAAGADPNEGELRKLTAEANRLASSVAVRQGPGGEVRRSIEFEARIKAEQLQHRAAQGEVHAFARANRESLSSSPEVARGHAAVLEVFGHLRHAARAHRAATDALDHLAILCDGRATWRVPNNAADLLSSIRATLQDLRPPLPLELVTETRLRALRELGQDRQAHALDLKLHEREARDAEASRLRARQAQRERDRQESWRRPVKPAA